MVTCCSSGYVKLLVWHSNTGCPSAALISSSCILITRGQGCCLPHLSYDDADDDNVSLVGIGQDSHMLDQEPCQAQPSPDAHAIDRQSLQSNCNLCD